MGLAVWCPLTTNIRNYGIGYKGANNYTIIQAIPYNVTLGTNGKLGGCAVFNGSNSYIELTNVHTLNGSLRYYQRSFSIAMWVYHADATRGILFGNYGLSNSNNFNVELKTDHTIRFYWNANPDFTFNSMLNVGLNTWSHIVITYNGNTKQLSGYLNGNLIQTVSNALSSNLNNYGGSSYYLGRDSRTGTTAFNGCMNDFRLYDHCLSPLEVKEIAQGLVLHYKMDHINHFSDLIQPSSSINTYNNYSSSSTATLAQVAISNTTHPSIYAGRQVYKQTYTTTTSNIVTHVKTVLSGHGVRTGPYYTFQAGRKYVYWIYYKPISHDDTICGGTASNIGGWTEIPPEPVGGGWYRVGMYRDGSATEDKTDYVFSSFKIPSYVSGEQIIILWTLPHLIADTIEIPDYDYSNNIVPDSSGNGYFGTIVTDSTILSETVQKDNNPAHLKSAIHFGATSAKIRSSTFATSSFANSYSFAWWEKRNSYSNTMAWGFSDGVRLNGMYYGNLWNTGDSQNNPLYNIGTTTQVTAPTANTWHHFVMTGNGTVCQVYKDGVLWAQAKTYKTISGTEIWINGWNSATSYSSNNMSICDFRIYSTVLTEDDVKRLYNTSMMIDNTYKAHTLEFVEKKVNKMYLPNLAIANGADNSKYGLPGGYTQTYTTYSYESSSPAYNIKTQSSYPEYPSKKIMREANITYSGSSNGTYGGLRICNSTDNTIHVYDPEKDNIFNLQPGHTYMFILRVWGITENLPYFDVTNNMGWSGTSYGLSSPVTNTFTGQIAYAEGWDHYYADFEGGQDIYYKFTIPSNTTIVKTCTGNYSSFVSGNKYLTYKHFTWQWTYANTGAWGTDMKVTNIRLFDITEDANSEITRTGLAKFTNFFEIPCTNINYANELEASTLIEY